MRASQIRLKEIGIRKVLGASASAIVLMLSANFLTLIFNAIAIALPTSWYIMTLWMKNFAYKSGLPGWVFLVSSLSVIAIALLTIGYQSVRAALENPVKTLKHE